MNEYTIYVNATEDENAVTTAYSYVTGCRAFRFLPKKNNGGLAFKVESNRPRKDIVADLNNSGKLPKDAYAS